MSHDSDDDDAKGSLVIICQDEFDQLIAIVKKIVIDKGVPQKILYKNITKKLQEECNETEYILYNTCYGGFGVTKTFLKFANLDEYTCDRRVGLYKHIVEFGKHTADKYPILLDIIYTYHQSDFSSQFSKCRKYMLDEDHNRRLQHNLTVLQDIKVSYGNINTLPKWKRSSPLQESFNLRYNTLKTTDFIDMEIVTGDTHEHETYTIDEIINYLENAIQETTMTLRDIKETIDDRCLTTLSYKFDEEIENDKLKWFERVKWDEQFSFQKALDTYGVEHCIPWKCQKVCEETYIRHILIHKMQKLYDQHMGDLYQTSKNEDVLNQCYLTIGLLCASSKYASLAFKKIPKGLSWSIGEYDGKECVIID